MLENKLEMNVDYFEKKLRKRSKQTEIFSGTSIFCSKMDEKSDVSLMELEQKDVPRTEDTFSLQSVTEDEAVLGRDATKFFMNEEYHECLPILQQLAEKRPNDARVLTNLAVCKFYAS